MIKASTIKQSIPECVTVYRNKPQYPSWPAPVREFRCACGFRIVLEKSGRAQIRAAVNRCWRHAHWAAKHLAWQERRAGVRRLPLRKSRRIATLKPAEAEAQRIKWREQRRRRRATLKRLRSKRRAR